MLEPQWQIQPAVSLPVDFLAAVRQSLLESSGQESFGQFVAQLLWQRGIREQAHLAGFVDPQRYQPTSAFAFGQEMEWAIERLSRAYHTAEKVAIWGDFDADGVTATAVLWEGLGAFFPQRERLTYFIPNRLTESHGLSKAEIEQLAQAGYSLIVTCDTGSTNLSEIQFAQSRGVDLIITDHHLLLKERPPVMALINPRCLPAEHPLFHLSGVAVAYKLVEALYETLPAVPQRPLADLLDLVAIGLIADLVNLTGDCRYLAQQGIRALQKNQDPVDPPRPGIAKLLELCRRSGDRPTDISFGLGPRINAISRIQGDARFCVELLTSRDRERCQQLALETELANTRRKALQREVMQQAKQKLAEIDLSTTPVIVLSDPQWSVGILGLVAGQLAQEYGRPTILLSTELAPVAPSTQPLARGSARSVNRIDLYELLQQQAHWLHRFGGHPFAVGLSLPIENIPNFTQSINQALRTKHSEIAPPSLQVDLTVTVADLGKALFQELRLLEPYGMGNPVPKLLIRDCWFSKPWHRKIQDLTGRKLAYIKTEFELCDESRSEGFPGVWWGHYKDELPLGRCDAIVELDFNSYEDAKRKKRYEVRLIAVRASSPIAPISASIDWLLDWRGLPEAKTTDPQPSEAVLQITDCPASWDELGHWLRQAKQTQQKLALAYGSPTVESPALLWQQLVELAESLSQSKEWVDCQAVQQKLGLSDRALQIGCQTLKLIGFRVQVIEQRLQIQQFEPVQPVGNSASNLASNNPAFAAALEQFFQIVQEEQFRRQYFYQAPLTTIQTVAEQMIGNL